MGEHPHDAGIDMLYEADEEQPSATLVLGEDGPGLAVTTG
jgi:hypothetical protein